MVSLPALASTGRPKAKGKERPTKQDTRICKSKYWRKKIKRELIKRKAPEQVGPFNPYTLPAGTNIVDFYSGHLMRPDSFEDRQAFARFAVREINKDLVPARITSQATTSTNEGESGTVFDGGESIVPQKILGAIRVDGQADVDNDVQDNPVARNKTEEPEEWSDLNVASQSIFSSSPHSLGPPVAPCALFLQATKCGTYGRSKMALWKSPLWPALFPGGQVKGKALLSTQITAVVFLLSRLLGTIPPIKDNETAAEVANRQRLRGPHNFGAILADSMGLGKTMTVAALLVLLASRGWNTWTKTDETTGASRKEYRPMLLLPPNLTVSGQWIEEILQCSTKDEILSIIVAGGSGSSFPTNVRVRHLSQTQFQDWPDDLSFVWDKTDPKASRTIIIVPIDTFSHRTIKKKEAGQDGKTTEEFYSTWEALGRAVSVAVVDEAHRVKNIKTRAWKSVGLLPRRYTVLVSATPATNTLRDLLGMGALLWPSSRDHLMSKTEQWARWDRDIHNLRDLKRELDAVPAWGDMRLLAGRPALLARLLTGPSSSGQPGVEVTREYLKYFESLCILKRGPGSTIFADWGHKKPIHLIGLMPEVQNSTVHIDLNNGDPGLAAAYQTAHLKILIKNVQGLVGHGFHTTHRRMQLAVASLDVKRLDRLFDRNKFGTKVDRIKLLRQNGVNLIRLSRFMLDSDDAAPIRAIDYIRLAVRRSPVLRYILHDVCENVLQQEGEEGSSSIKKLLITERSPVLAWYYEIVLQFLGIHCRTLHAALNQDQRHDLIASFNAPNQDSCQVLIQMYSVAGAGTNLHQACHRVIVATPAHSLPVQAQTVHRVIRVAQTHGVQVLRLKVSNSYHDFAEAFATEKMLPELASRAQGTEMIHALVRLLNIYQREVTEAWQSDEGKALMRDMRLCLSENFEGPRRNKRQKLDSIGGQPVDMAPDSSAPESNVHALCPALCTPEPSAIDCLGFRALTIQEDDPRNDKEASNTDASTGQKRKRMEPMAAAKADGPLPLGWHYQPPAVGTGVTAANHKLDAFLRLKTRQDYNAEYKALDGRSKSLFSHEKQQMRRILSFGYPRNHHQTPIVWTAADLDKPAVLERALELLLRVRHGDPKPVPVLPMPYINFGLAPKRKRRQLYNLLRCNDIRTTDKDVHRCGEAPYQQRKAKLPKDELKNLVLEGYSNVMLDETIAREGWTMGNVKREKTQKDEVNLRDLPAFSGIATPEDDQENDARGDVVRMGSHLFAAQANSHIGGSVDFSEQEPDDTLKIVPMKSVKPEHVEAPGLPHHLPTRDDPALTHNHGIKQEPLSPAEDHVMSNTPFAPLTESTKGFTESRARLATQSGVGSSYASAILLDDDNDDDDNGRQQALRMAMKRRRQQRRR